MDALAQAMATRTMLMRDDEGRALGEAKAEQMRPSGARFELRSCPYSGSRHHHARPMNFSALRQVSTHWRGILGAIAYLHALHDRKRAAGAPRVDDCWRIGNMTNAVADFAFMRQWQPYGDGELPALIGALYKITLGVTSTSFAAWADGTVGFRAPIDGPFLFDYAERCGQLIGPEQVCGGTQAMILELLEVLLHGGDPGAGGRIAASVVGDEERFVRFCDGTAVLRLVRAAFERVDASLRYELAAALPEAGVHTRQSLLRDLTPDSWLMHYVGRSPKERLAQLDDVLSTATDARFCRAPEVAAGARRMLAAVARERTPELSNAARVVVDAVARTERPSRHAELTRVIASYLDLENIGATIARVLKAELADVLHIEPASTTASALGLVGFVPLRASRPSMRAALRVAFGVDVAAPDGHVTVSLDDRQLTLEARE